MEYGNRLAANYWSQVDCSASDKNFFCFPPIRSHSCKLIFDEVDAAEKNWCEYWTVEKYLKDKIPFENALSICCGFGEVERTLAKFNVAKRITGVDIAPGAIEQARIRAKDEKINNIEYYVADINKDKFPCDCYDLIWANGALHHIKNLEHVIPMLYEALKCGGYLISNEYVGPKYQQIPKRQQELVNAVRHLLPPEFRNNKNVKDGAIKTRIYKFLKNLWLNGLFPNKIYGRLWRPTPVGYFMITDPTECVNSDKIIPILTDNFDEVEVKYFGGSILFYALNDEFYNNFDLHNPDHLKLLDMLLNIEDTLIETGELKSDNAHIICRKV